MRCKKHPLDLSGSVGVCASCLRERLLILIAAQEAQQSQQQQQQRSSSAGGGAAAAAIAVEDRRKYDPHPPPLIFPRSVSPYISRRKSDYNSCHDPNLPFPDQRFYSTPQVGPTAASGAGARSCKKKSSRLAIISRIFWPRSEKFDLDLGVSRDPCTTSPSSSSSSWFSSFVSGRRRKKSNLRFTPGDRRPCRPDDRGMSPERTSCDGEDCDRSSGGYSSDSSEKWKRTPVSAPVTTVARRGKPSHVRNVSGLAFCLSPLVRASPNRNWSQRGLPPEIGLPGEIRVPAKPHLSTAASFCSNRSRKLADFGRFSNNR